jgi:hypothetical protein
MLCSSCELADGLVQFEEPKIVIRWPRSSVVFWWCQPACFRFRIFTPAGAITA